MDQLRLLLEDTSQCSFRRVTILAETVSPVRHDEKKGLHQQHLDWWKKRESRANA